MAQSFIKDIDAKLDYTIDWSSWLTGSETIATSTWTVPSGITKISDSHTNTKTTIWLSGGTVATEYQFINHIITNDARNDDRTITIHCTEK